MVVTKTSFVFVLVVLAIIYNQGAARSVHSGTFKTKNWLSSSSSESQADSDGEEVFTIPTVLKEGDVITINSTVDADASKFILELPSISDETKCQLTFIYGKDYVYVLPAVEGYENSEYCLNVTSGDPERQNFLLTLVPRRIHNNDMIAMTFYNTVVGISSQLMCNVENIEDINQIVIKEGVSHVNSLLFEFE